MIFLLRFQLILLMFVVEHRQLSNAAPTTFVNCDEFANDFDVINRFPFPVVVNPESIFDSINDNVVYTYANDSQKICELDIREEEFVPPSFVCLRDLRELGVRNTPFYQNIVPDQLADLKKLQHLYISGSPIDHMTEQLSSMTQLFMIQFIGCKLKSLPDFSNLHNLVVLQVQHNQLKELTGLQNLVILSLRSNQFEELPIIAYKENVTFVSADDNPLKNVQSVWSYPNIEGIYLARVGLKSLPTDIDKMTNLKYIYLSGNKLTHLPRTILNLDKLEELEIQNNLFSENNRQAIRDNFKKFRPQTKLTIETDSIANESN